MDYELIFWVVAPVLAFVLLVMVSFTKDIKEIDEFRQKQKAREHEDDFNKDL